MSSSILPSCAFALVLMAAVLPLGSAIRCYNCTSLTNGKCAETLPANPGDELKGTLWIDCANMDMTRVEKPYNEQKPTFCRKIVQEVEGRTNIIRACGVVRDDTRPCYTAGAKGSHSTVCQCSDDFCNSALPSSMSWPSVLLPVIVTAVLVAGN